MLSTLVFTSLVVLAPALRVAAFAVNNPEVSACGDAHISWEAREGPYSVWIINPEDPCEDPYVDLGADHMGTTMTWRNAGVPAGLKIQIAMQDKNGEEAWSDIITVKAAQDGATCDIPKELAALAPATTSTTESTTSTSATQDGTTLVVTPTTTATSEPTVAPVAAGAAKDQGFGNSASSVKSSTPLVLAGALVGALFVAL